MSIGISRRSFLASIGAGVPLIGGCRGTPTASNRAATTAPDAEGRIEGTVRVPTRALGKTGMRVPVLEVGGTYRFNARYVRAALDLGCNFFDTAASYVNGKSEQTLGEAVAKLGVRKEVVIVTKGHPHEPERLEATIDASLARLGMDYVDVYYIHNLSRVGVIQGNAWRDAVEQIKKKGKIRHFGFSAHNENVVALLHAAAAAGWIDVIMLKYNFRSYGDAELSGALDAAHKANIGLIAMKTQGSAVSFGDRVDPFQAAGYSKHQAVLKAVWKDERLAAAISAMPSIAVLHENAAAATQKLSATESELLETYAARTARGYCHGGCGGCRRECEQATGRELAIADGLRYLMYHDVYGQRPEARRKFSALPVERRSWSTTDLERAEAACPHGLPLVKLIGRASSVLGEGEA